MDNLDSLTGLQLLLELMWKKGSSLRLLHPSWLVMAVLDTPSGLSHLLLLLNHSNIARVIIVRGVCCL